MENSLTAIVYPIFLFIPKIAFHSVGLQGMRVKWKCFIFINMKYFHVQSKHIWDPHGILSELLIDLRELKIERI